MVRLIACSLVLTLGCMSAEPPGEEATMDAAGVASDEVPPMGHAALTAWLADGHYLTWACEPEAHPARPPGAHGANRICSNTALSSSESGTFPIGASSVKELYSNGSLNGYAVGRKLTSGADRASCTGTRRSARASSPTVQAQACVRAATRTRRATTCSPRSDEREANVTVPPMMRILLAVGLAAIAGCADGADRPARWSYIHAAIVAPSCATAGCHSKITSIAGLDLSSREGAYTILTARVCGEPEPAQGAPHNFIVPYAPEASRLYHQLLGQNTDRMPPDTALPAVEIALIAQWIEEGATCE